MRFSIRDLLWLMAVVALGATVWVERVAMQRQAAQAAALKAKGEEEFALAQARKDARIRGLAEQNNLLQHQLVVNLERQREAEAAAKAERQQQENVRSRRSPAAAAPGPIDFPADSEQ